MNSQRGQRPHPAVSNRIDRIPIDGDVLFPLNQRFHRSIRALTSSGYVRNRRQQRKLQRQTLQPVATLEQPVVDHVPIFLDARRVVADLHVAKVGQRGQQSRVERGGL